MAPTVAGDAPGVSVETEQAVLGALLSDPERWPEVRDLFAADLFEAAAHRALAVTMARMFDAGTTVDACLVQEQLQAEGKLGAVVPPHLPFVLWRAVGTTANLRYYVERLVELRGVRRGGEDGAILDRAAPTVGRFARGALDEMRRRAAGDVAPIATPWKALNALLGGGFWAGLHVVTGTTGSGKTQLALQAAVAAARRFAAELQGDETATGGAPVLYVALELTRTELVARLLSLLLAEAPGRGGRGVMWSDLFLGKDRHALAHAEQECAPILETLPLRIEEAPAGVWTASHLARRVSGLRAMYRRTPLVVLDYLQIVGPEEPRQDLRACIRSAALAARNAAREGAAVLLLSSVSRENAKLIGPGNDGTRPPSDPTALVGLGKESGEIEFSADTVLALVREEYREGGTPMHLAAAKVRAGRPGWVSLSFDGSAFSPAPGASPRQQESRPHRDRDPGPFGDGVPLVRT